MMFRLFRLPLKKKDTRLQNYKKGSNPYISYYIRLLLTRLLPLLGYRINNIYINNNTCTRISIFIYMCIYTRVCVKAVFIPGKLVKVVTFFKTVTV